MQLIFINMNPLQLALILFVVPLLGKSQTQISNEHAVCFYYNWYGSIAVDGKPYHWSHPVMKQHPNDTIQTEFPGAGAIGADFYPQSGEYSSGDSAIIEKHMQQVATAGIGLLAVTWLGQTDYTARSVPLLLNAAQRHGIRICFQIEPIVRKTALTTRDAIVYLVQTYGEHPAFYRDVKTHRPLFFVYDSYVIPSSDWADILHKHGSHTIRHTPFNADIIGLWVEKNDAQFFRHAGFDGFYTYFASAGFTYGSTPANWRHLQRWAYRHRMKFIPSVGPGYCDNRIRPWNKRNTKNRFNGQYYDSMFSAAIRSRTRWIGITSFNEWHEGTQIEPAVPKQYNGFTYLDYQPLSPDYYLQRTAYWLKRWHQN